MANILDEQERKRKELAAQGIRTRGVAGAQGGPAEMTYKPLEQRTGAEAKALGVSPQMQGQIAQEQGLIPPAALPTPAVTPSQAPAQQARVTAPQAQGVTPQAQGVTPQAQAANQQLQMQRNEMGTNNTSLTQMAAQIDPSIKRDAERAREWRIMSPQQRRDEVDRLAMEQDARTAGQMIQTTPEDIQSYGRSLADASGTFIDSYGRSSPMYSPETQLRIRGYQREMEKEASDMLSGYDKTKWQSPKDLYDAIAALPSAQKAGEFGKSIAFNIARKYSTPQMKAQMEAEDRNQKAFEQTFTAKAAEEIVTRMVQEGKVSQEYAQGYRFTNDGSKEFATQIWLNKDNDPIAGQIVNEIMANAPVMWMEEGGRVVQDPAHQERRRMMLERERTAKAAAAKAEERRALEEYEDQRFAAIQQMNPERAAMMIKNPITGKYDDLEEYAPEKQETNWDEIYQNDARVAATESLLSWGRFRTEEEAAAEAARQFPIRTDLPPTDPLNQRALFEQQKAVEVWRTQVNPPEKRAELERDLYNLKLRGQELRKGFQNPPQAAAQASAPQSAENITLNSPAASASSPVAPQPRQSQPAYRETPLGSGKNQNRQNYEKAGTFRVGTLPDESTYEQYKATGRISVSYGEMDKIPIAVSVAGKNEYITMVDPGEFSSFMKKQAVGPVSPVKVRVVPISDIAEISVSDKEVERMRTRFGITPFASKKRVLAVAADRINRKNKKRVHPFKNLLDWSPDLEWFRA